MSTYLQLDILPLVCVRLVIYALIYNFLFLRKRIFIGAHFFFNLAIMLVWLLFISISFLPFDVYLLGIKYIKGYV